MHHDCFLAEKTLWALYCFLWEVWPVVYPMQSKPVSTRYRICETKTQVQLAAAKVRLVARPFCPLGWPRQRSPASHACYLMVDHLLHCWTHC